MSQPGSTDAGSYRVCCPRHLLDQLRRLADRARQESPATHRDFVLSLKEVNRRLQTDPVGWGDPLFTYRELNMRMCHGVYHILHAYYGVNEEQRLVFVQDILPMPGHLPDPP